MLTDETIALKTEIEKLRQSLYQAFCQSRSAKFFFKQYTAAVDQLLLSLWEKITVKNYALVAVGGYGRQELYPYSDIDILILVDSEEDCPDRQIEHFIHEAWNIGISPSHSVRTPAQCVTAAKMDLSAETSLLDARFLAGDSILFARLLRLLNCAHDRERFFLSKLKEQKRRHIRFDETPYKLEPNIKESPGGLRDAHMIHWLVKASLGHTGTTAILSANLLDRSETQRFFQAFYFLAGLRIHLHMLAKREENRLSFDMQLALCKTLALDDRNANKASEQLMHRYFLAAKTIALINELVTAQIRERVLPIMSASIPLHGPWVKRDCFLSLRTPNLLQEDPSAIFQAFLVLQRHPSLVGFDAETTRALCAAVRYIDGSFRRNPKNLANFAQLWRANQKIATIATMLNRYGILGAYLPEFSRIVGRMQHDLYHIYTVDEHILRVIRNLRHFCLPEHANAFPLCHQLIQSFKKPELLYFAALYHDIGKGQGGDHSEIGAKLVERFARHHGLYEDEIDLVVFLVRHHLLMSMTVQKKDISDPQVVLEFSQTVGTPERLDALFLLTVADIRGTNPKAWNNWKRTLLETLYLDAKACLSGKSISEQHRVFEHREAALVLLKAEAVSEEACRALWQHMDEDYFLHFEPESIAWHTRALSGKSMEQFPIVKARIDPKTQMLSVFFFAKASDALFFRACCFFEKQSCNIVEANVYSTNDGFVLMSFLLSGKDDSLRPFIDYIEYELRQALLTTHTRALPSAHWPRHLRVFPKRAEVNFTTNGTKRYTGVLLTTMDYPGLLSGVARVFQMQNIILHHAKITTLGEKVEDTFFVTDKKGRPLESNKKRALSQALICSMI